MRFSLLVSVAALSAAVSASPDKRQDDKCAAQCSSEQKLCTFRESPDCPVVCTATEYNKWVACHSCLLSVPDVARADEVKGFISRLAAGCLSTGNSLTGGPTSALSTVTASAAANTPSASAVTPSASGSAAPSSSASAASASASAPAATGTSGAMDRAVPVLAGVAGAAIALLA
ncbi:hypothetical protein CcaverHIS002_0403920 [Cutaneotrichosporon cavernicola]|uniref:Extracellular membrane protein CFEM domain-containing protein n=1 Tax=Cutaneotrichosporon cavernicola TaxID=279322 RepID=A0AA48L429_9TREE|nr:uncharacterized protein CcaverHIS019_0403870 [Cutaneotrichosporon cavernicola]BEI83788.1 hypothetical protein CcaverHIS002_0403920 [Cutaneotrichosporon cavernicola]BEI91567.1 hypothetical protein CcaverHIS019_0403870 [Cutaneotrichosporon cavernicola]BEI99344.1 hypothetical protein CcaverHIS631_0403870 [Cutaneotrichosporon cavernicola]BEJ07119.1 hypothetical protein CcaverHIS641_0403880 [Cutaneotrichosporon cavernicola]